MRSLLKICALSSILFPCVYGRQEQSTNFELWLNFNNYYRLELIQATAKSKYDNIFTEISVLPLVWLPEDPYNRDKSNFSANIIINPALAYLQKTIQSEPSNMLNLSLQTLRLITNGRIHWQINSDFSTPASFKPKQNSFGLFIQNTSDFFVGRTNLWIQFLPGLGVNYLSPHGFFINAGYLKKMDYRFIRLTSDNNWFLSVGIFMEAFR